MGARPLDAAWLACFSGGLGAAGCEEPSRFVGTSVDGEAYEGQIICGGCIGAVHGGVADFTRPSPHSLSLPGLDNIARNWDSFNGLRGSDLAAELAAVDGPICEIAAGPGGGFMPTVRRLNPAARIMVNDGSPAVVSLWRTFLASRGLSGGLCFAAFDLTEPVLRPGCLAAVSSAAGFTNVDGFSADPVHEAVLRVKAALRPGGLVFADEAIIDPADWSHLRGEARMRWEAQPFVATHLAVSISERLRRAGFEVLRRDVHPGRALDPDEGLIPREAAKYGITLHTRREVVRARRP